MPKVKWSIDPDEPDELEQFGVYEGPDLHAGVYHGILKRLTVKKNKNDDDMLSGLFEVRESGAENDKDKYNGAGIWFNQNVTDQGKPYTLAFLKSLGLTWRDFTHNTVTAEATRPTQIVKIGRVKFNDGNEPPLRVSIGMGKGNPEYPAKIEIKQFLPPKDGDAEWDASGDVNDEDNPFA